MSSKITKAEKSNLLYLKYEELQDDINTGKKIKLLKKSVRLNCMNLSAIFELAEQFRKIRNYREAAVLYNLILDIDPGNYDALFGAAKCCYKMKEYETACEYYEKLFITTPDSRPLLIELIKTHTKLMNSEKVFHYIHLARPFIKDRREINLVFVKASEALWYAGHSEKAMSYIERLIKNETDNYYYYVRRILYLMYDGKHDQALERCEEFKEMSRDSDYIFLKLSIMLDAKRILELSKLFDENYEEIIGHFSNHNIFNFWTSYLFCDREFDGMKVIEKCILKKINNNSFLMYAIDYFFSNEFYEFSFYIASIIIKKHNVSLIDRGYAYYKIAQYYRIYEKNYPAAVKYGLEALNYDETLSLLYEVGAATMLSGYGQKALIFFYKFLNRYERLDEKSRLEKSKQYEFTLNNIEKIKKQLNL
ncbi:MAG: tetratricopeptide repeat protein [Candidatus Wallbacteria bacterium]